MKKLLKNLILFTVVVLFDTAHQSMSQNQRMQQIFYAAAPTKKSTRRRRDLPTGTDSEMFHIPRVYESVHAPAAHKPSIKHVESLQAVTPVASSHVPYPLASYQDPQRSYGHRQGQEQYYSPQSPYGQNYGPERSHGKNASPQSAPSQDSSPQGVSTQPNKNKDLETTDVGQVVNLPTNSSFKGSNPAEKHQAAPKQVSPAVTSPPVTPTLPQPGSFSVPWQAAVLGIPPVASYLLGGTESETIEQDLDFSIAPFEMNVGVDDPVSHNVSSQDFAFGTPEAPFIQTQPIELSPNVSLPEPLVLEVASASPESSQSNLELIPEVPLAAEDIAAEEIVVEEIVDVASVEPVEAATIVEQSVSLLSANDVAVGVTAETKSNKLRPMKFELMPTQQAAQVSQAASKGLLGRATDALYDYVANLRKNPYKAIGALTTAAAIALPMYASSTAQLSDVGIENAVQSYVAARPALIVPSVGGPTIPAVSNSSIGATMTAALVQIAASAKNIRFIP